MAVRRPPRESATRCPRPEGWRRSQPSPRRGCGREAISISRPPTPMPLMSAPLIGTSASTRCSTQSKPFSLGERAQPGAPMIGRSSIARRAAADCRDRPACRNDRPGRRTPRSAAGMTSRRSVIAEAPKISRTSQSGAIAVERVGKGVDAHARRAPRARCARRPAPAAPPERASSWRRRSA